MLNEIKLNMNEMPYLPPMEVIEAAKKGLSKLNRYADPEDLELLRGLLADYSDVARKHIILSAGSDLLLREVIHVFSSGKKVIMVNPSFFPTAQCAKEFVTKLIKIQLRPPEFNLDTDIITNETNEPCLVIIDNPNNPTGTIIPQQDILEILDTGLPVLMDEAYYEFSGQTVAPLVGRYENLMVLRTFSKWTVDFFNCRCKENPFCDCGIWTVSKAVLELRYRGLTPSQINATFLEEYELFIYPGDIFGFLDNQVHILQGINRVAEVIGRYELAENAAKVIEAIENPFNSET